MGETVASIDDFTEGVDEAWSLGLLRDSGCDYAEGHVIAQPTTGAVALP